MSNAPPSDGRIAGPEPSPFSRPGFLIAAAVVLVLIVLAGFLIFTGGDDEQATPPPSSTATSIPPGSDQSDQSADGACDLPADDQSVPVSAPDTDWTLVGTVAAPSSPEAGPSVIDPATGVRTCYAQTPTGALFAAANFLAAVTDPEALVAAVESLTADGPGRDALLDQVRTDPAAALGTGARFQIAGFTFLSYSEDVASVSLAIAATGGLAGAPLTVVWEDGDWKVDLPPDGNPAGQAAPISGLSGYISWAGA